jgi:undecaprenyl-phosphate 4-deoxy-4-formamido-L-arabinose transferase
VRFNGISVVVPVYNGRQTLEMLVSRLEAVLSALADNFEIILVNDDSKDDSWQVIEKLVERKKTVGALSLMRNYGQHNALLAGIRIAHYEVIVTIDDDLQHPPEEIPKLLERLNEGYDVVYGTAETEQHGLWRNLASQITKMALSSVINVKIARKVSAFRAFRTSLRDSFADYRGAHPSIDVLLSWGTNRFGSVSVRHQSREKGRSNYTFAKLVTHALNMITGFSTLPLRIASILGFSFTLFGFFVLAFVVIRYLVSGSPVAGFPFLASTIAIFSGVQLFAIGIIGEYLARMYIRMMDRPGYVIREKKEHQNT